MGGVAANGALAGLRKTLTPNPITFEIETYLQGDSTLRHVKDLDVVLGAETAVLILDDTSGVWPLHQRNLLQVLIPILLSPRVTPDPWTLQASAELCAPPCPTLLSARVCFVVLSGFREHSFPLGSGGVGAQ